VRKTVLIIPFIVLSSFTFPVHAQYDVRNFGAKGDGKTLDTYSIQNAIDTVNGKGGGSVEISAGTYLIGTLILKDNVELHLQRGAVLLGSPDYRNYTEIIQKFQSRTNGLYAKYFMIFAEGGNNISITGSGIINGNGLNYFKENDPQNLRPFLIRLVDCENITVRDVHLLESANWTLHLLGCRNVNVDGIVIKNGIDGNRDGLDIDCCQRVCVSNSNFSTGDDAIVMKSSSDILCQDISITNCLIRTRASAIKTGTESNGGFKNITVSNCIIRDLPIHAGIELMTVDGGIMQNILLDNITMENVGTPVFIRVGIRARPYMKGQYVKKIDDAKDITLNNISVLNAKFPSSIMGLNNRKIKNVTITNYSVRNSEAQKPVPYNLVPFEEFSYPMAIMFKNLPASGLYCRNVEELHLQNLIMYSADNETRPALAFDRVNGLELLSVKASNKNQTIPMVHFRNVKNVSAGFCRSVDRSDLLFEAEENSCESLNLSNNILFPGQKEIARVHALKDEQLFEDFNTDLKYSVEKGEPFKYLSHHDLKINPLKFSINITKRGSLQLCLLILNDSSIPEKVFIKYEGITQEFTINWNEWGWAPVTLLKEFPADKTVEFEILAEMENTNLKISKAYVRYQDIKKTD
jgi:Glycosyl hydrolases family 28